MGIWTRQHACLAGALLAVFGLQSAHAQALRISNRGEIGIPEYATFRLGPFYSAGSFSQSVAVRWTESHGSGTDFLNDTERGVILEDGWDVPLISTISLRNYLILSRNMDLDLALSVSYEHYPMDTQEDRWRFNLAEEGVFATFLSEFRLSENIYGSIYWSPTYRTDFVDARGESDNFAGSEFEYFQSDVGVSIDWLIARDRDLGIDFGRLDFLPRTQEFKNQKRVEHYGNILFEQPVLPYTVAGVEVSRRDINYDDSARADSYIDTVSAYLRFLFNEGRGSALRPTRNSSITGSIGYSRGVTEAIGDTPTLAGASADESEGLTWQVQFDWGEEGALSRNMTHGLSYSRTINSTFESGLALTDTLRYHWLWLVGLWDLGFGSEYQDVDPLSDRSNGYSNWRTGLTADYHLTEYATVKALSVYEVRNNDDLRKGQTLPLPADQVEDYNTWINRIGTEFDLTRNIVFFTYFQHAERDSSFVDLDFERNTLEARLTYTHQF